jgi:hypothetical protein
MSKARILNNNWIDTETLTSYTKSSELTDFPATNIYNYERRSKVWRSAGYWNITASNNKIVFREAGTTDLTATIAVAEYTTTASFLAAIKTALDAAGASTYTVAQDTTTLKIKITAVLGGGASKLDLMWTDANSTAATTLGFSTAADDTGALTYTADTLKIHTSEWLRWDLGTSGNPNAFVLIGPRDKAITLTSGAVVKLQGNSSDSWASPAYEKTLTLDDRAIIETSTSGLHSSALRYWRLEITDASNPLGYVEIGVVYLGAYFEPTRGAVQFPFGADYVDHTEMSRSEGGQTFADIKAKTMDLAPEWFGLTIAEKETIDDHFEEVGIGRPWFIQLDPDLVYSTSQGIYTRYVKFTSAPGYTLVAPGVFSMDMTLREDL